MYILIYALLGDGNCSTHSIEYNTKLAADEAKEEIRKQARVQWVIVTCKG